MVPNSLNLIPEKKLKMGNLYLLSITYLIRNGWVIHSVAYMTLGSIISLSYL